MASENSVERMGCEIPHNSWPNPKRLHLNSMLPTTHSYWPKHCMTNSGTTAKQNNNAEHALYFFTDSHKASNNISIHSRFINSQNARHTQRSSRESRLVHKRKQNILCSSLCLSLLHIENKRTVRSSLRLSLHHIENKRSAHSSFAACCRGVASYQ